MLHVILLTDINECQSNNGGCSHFCVNVPGNYSCQCPQGYDIGQENPKLCAGEVIEDPVEPLYSESLRNKRS